MTAETAPSKASRRGGGATPAASLVGMKVPRKRSGENGAKKAGDITQHLMTSTAAVAAPPPPVVEAPPPKVVPPPAPSAFKKKAIELPAEPPPLRVEVAPPPSPEPEEEEEDEALELEEDVTPRLAVPAPEPVVVLPKSEPEPEPEPAPPRRPVDIVEYWESLRQNRAVPRLDAIDRRLIAESWPNSLVVSFGPDESAMPRISRIGEATEDIEYSPMVTDWILSRARHVARRSEKFEEEQMFPHGQDVARYRLMVMPLATAEGKSEHVLCHLRRASEGGTGTAFRRWAAS